MYSRQHARHPRLVDCFAEPQAKAVCQRFPAASCAAPGRTRFSQVALPMSKLFLRRHMSSTCTLVSRRSLVVQSCTQAVLGSSSCERRSAAGQLTTLAALGCTRVGATIEKAVSRPPAAGSRLRRDLKSQTGAASELSPSHGSCARGRTRCRARPRSRATVASHTATCRSSRLTRRRRTRQENARLSTPRRDIVCETLDASSLA
ncbi:hypothetical protein C8T65DRAFT_163966 [Cerioporus squamosus]|nr:hypothetical protein C8T65DRAFT_163966 [Cerioporus squamosus]